MKVAGERERTKAKLKVIPVYTCDTCSVKKPVKYDPSKSEAYKALQEEEFGDQVQEVRQPVRTGVFSPQKLNKVCFQIKEYGDI